MTAGSLGGTGGLTEYDFHIRDDFAGDALNGRSVGYSGIYRTPPADEMSKQLRACSQPDWYRSRGAEMPSMQNGSVEFSGLSRQSIHTPCSLDEGTWVMTFTASDGTTDDAPFFFRWFNRPDGEGYAVRVEGGGNGTGDVSLLRYDGPDIAEELDSASDAISDLTTATTLTVSRTISGDQSLDVDGSSVASAQDPNVSDPMRVEFDYRPNDYDRTYTVSDLTIK